MPHTAMSSALTDTGNAAIPKHVAIIMDGNGRWAQQHALPRKLGHKRGADALRKLLEGCKELGLEFLTLYAFSSENWNRSRDEVSDLMDLLRLYLKQELPFIHDNGIRLRIIGDREALDEDIRQQIEAAEHLTHDNTNFQLVIALSYGSRQELVRAARKLAQLVKEGQIEPEAITEALFMAQLDTQGIPEPDLLIRTGGEQRLSNFLLWQSAYTELYFTELFWPDFTLDHLKEAMQDYAQRERRFGSRIKA